MRAAPAAAQAEITGSGSVTAGARPTSRPRVVLLAVTADDPLAARLAAELETLGLDVSRAQIDPVLPIDDLVRQALAGGARGVVVADGRRTEFWVAEEGSDRVAMRQELEIENSPAMESVLSLRTVEFLRVSLGLVGRAVTPPVVVPAVVPKPEEVGTRVAFNLMSGIVASTGRLAPFGAVSAALRVRIAGPVGIELRGMAPFASQELAGRTGPIDTSVWLAGGGLVLAPRTAARVAFDIGAGALAVMLRSSGNQTRRRRRVRHLWARRRPHPPQPELVGPPRCARRQHRPVAHHHHGPPGRHHLGPGIHLRAGRHRAGDMSRQPGGLTLTG